MNKSPKVKFTTQINNNLLRFTRPVDRRRNVFSTRYKLFYLSILDLSKIELSRAD